MNKASTMLSTDIQCVRKLFRPPDLFHIFVTLQPYYKIDQIVFSPLINLTKQK